MILGFFGMGMMIKHLKLEGTVKDLCEDRGKLVSTGFLDRPVKLSAHN